MNRPNLTDRVAPRAARDLALVFCFVLLPSLADCHGLMTIPRQRGCLNTQRNIPNRVLDSSAPIDYCPHCLNCGGVGNVRKGGPWKMFSPFDYERKGITMCGDAVGNNDHMRSGSFANPPSMPYGKSTRRTMETASNPVAWRYPMPYIFSLARCWHQLPSISYAN